MLCVLQYQIYSHFKILYIKIKSTFVSLVERPTPLWVAPFLGLEVLEQTKKKNAN